MTQARLSSLRVGQVATIAEVEGANGAAKRLADLGFVAGATVEMIRSGAPCIVRLDRTRLGLGNMLQDCVILQPSNVVVEVDGALA